MKRRDFLVQVLGGVCAAQAGAVAQEQPRRVSLLIGSAQDRDGIALVTEFRRSIRRLGWIEGRNLDLQIFWSDGNPAHVQSQADAVLKSNPGVVFTYSVRTLNALRQRTKDVPIVFVATSDPVGLGFVQSLARPGANLTGFTLFDYSMIGKMLQALKQIAPSVTRVALLHSPVNVSAKGYLKVLHDTSSQFSVLPVPAPIESSGDIERVLTSLAEQPGCGILVPPDVTAQANRELIVALAAKHRLPAIYANGSFVAAGGLMSYSVDLIDLFHRSAGYVDRIFRGETAAELPVQQPVKIVTALNKGAAAKLGLDIPSNLLVAADEVIE